MEKLFAKFWKTEAQRRKAHPGLVVFEDHRARLEMFVRLCDDSQKTVHIGGSLFSVGYQGDDLLLPMEAVWTSSSDLNLRLIEYLILKSSAIRSLRVVTDYHDRSRTWPRLAVLLQMPALNGWLDQRFLGFKNWEENLLKEFTNEIRCPVDSWRTLLVARPEDDVQWAIQNVQSMMKKNKRNDTLNPFLHATVPLPLRVISSIEDGHIDESAKRQSSSVQTQKSRKQREFTQSVDLDKEGAANPVIHSFEKMETLDDYDGGRRVDSGDDELAAHDDALNELELNRHTTSGSASSLYHQDASGFSRMQGGPETQVDVNMISYPEWSHKEQTYWRDHCKVSHLEVPQAASSLEERERIARQYKTVIGKWRRTIATILNVPLWKNRQLQGSELDLDNLVRLQSEPRGLTDRPYIYSQKTDLNLDLAILILVDGSYSTDSWVNGQRILDIIRDSVGVAGLLMESLIDSVMVAVSSSETRHRVQFYQYKDFSDNWDAYYKRANSLSPNAYTRLGPAIRHALGILEKQEARETLLVLLTDGKPTDLDPYEGRHGQEDVRMAIQEARAAGTKVLALTVSDFDSATLNHMFGSARSIAGPDDFCQEIFLFLQGIRS